MSKTICSIEQCQRATFGHGWCQMHYMRWHRTGDPLTTRRKRPSDVVFEDWFASMCKPVGECLVWQGGLYPDGYGATSWRGRQMGTHRVAWILQNGAIPKGFVVCHSCDNPPCVLVDHLWLGTQADNIADMMAKGRDRKATGERHHMTTLTEDQIREIRTRYAAGGVFQIALGKEYGVSKSCIGSIVRRQTWAHVE